MQENRPLLSNRLVKGVGKLSEIKRGDIYWTEFSPSIGSEQFGFRPSLVIQNDIGNKYSRTVIVAIITSKFKKKDFPTHVFLDKNKYNLEDDSVIMLEQIRTIDKWRIRDKICSLDENKMREVEEKLMKSLGIENVLIKVQDTDEIISIPKSKLIELGLINL